MKYVVTLLSQNTSFHKCISLFKAQIILKYGHSVDTLGDWVTMFCIFFFGLFCIFAEKMLLSLWHSVVLQVHNLLDLSDVSLKNERLDAFTSLISILREIVDAQSFKPDVILVRARFLFLQKAMQSPTVRH